MFKQLIALTVALLFIPVASALVVSDVSADTIAPGQQGRLDITLKNTLDVDVKDVSLTLDFTGLPLSPVGSSEQSVKEIDDDDRESFTFTIRADTSAKVGDYKVPYTITYKNASTTRKGTIGVRVAAPPTLSITGMIEKPVIGQQTKVTLTIVNKGLGEARFASLTAQFSGMTTLSEKQKYIGSIDSDDFETVTFIVIPTSKLASITGTLDYQDSDANKKTLSFDIPLTLYTHDEAVEKGIIAKNNTPIIMLSIAVLIILWLIYRTIAKRRRMRRAAEANLRGK